MPVYQYNAEQFIPASIDEVWNFISAPGNLKKITPEHMGFDVTTEVPDRMYAGLIIGYKVSPFPGMRTNWLTEITHVREKEYFVDEQRAGPYAMWHHQHFIHEVDGGTQMKDIITYRPPLGLLGAIANKLIIRRKLDQIFDYRRKAIDSYFPRANRSAPLAV